MLTDENAMYSTSYNMRRWIRRNFVINQTTGTKNLHWLSIKVIDHRIPDQMSKMSMNRPLTVQGYGQCLDQYFQFVKDMVLKKLELNHLYSFDPFDLEIYSHMIMLK